MNNLTPDQIKEEMKKIKIPFFIGFAEKFWFKFGKYVMIFGILAYIPAGIFYNKLESLTNADLMWNIMIGWFLFLMFGIGGLMLISHIIENIFVKKQAKRLGIEVWEWNAYAKDIGLVSYKN